MVDILTFDGFFGAKFDILKPRWLPTLAVRHAIPKSRDLAKAEFATLRLRLLKIAARVVEMASRVRLAFAAPCPEAELFASLPAVLMPSGP